MKTHISQIVKIEDTEGKYGPQKRITFKDENGRTISGWVPLKDFDQSVWTVGSSPDLEISQNGKYWNFKLPKKKEVPQSNEEVMKALREIYKKLTLIETNQQKTLNYLIQHDGVEPAPFEDEVTFP